MYVFCSKLAFFNVSHKTEASANTLAYYNIRTLWIHNVVIVQYPGLMFAGITLEWSTFKVTRRFGKITQFFEK